MPDPAAPPAAARAPRVRKTTAPRDALAKPAAAPVTTTAKKPPKASTATRTRKRAEPKGSGSAAPVVSIAPDLLVQAGTGAAAMAAPIDVGGGQRRVLTLSIGGAALKPGRVGEELKALGDRLLADADAAMYRAKAAGRDRVSASTG